MGRARGSERQKERIHLIKNKNYRKDLRATVNRATIKLKKNVATSGKGGRKMYDLNSAKFVQISKAVAKRLFDQGRMVYLTPSYIAIKRLNFEFQPTPIPYEARSFHEATIDFELQNWRYAYLANFWIVQNKERREKEMEWRLRGIFDLDWIQEYVKKNINQTEWIEEECEEKRRILLIETLIHGAHGAYIPGMVLEMFGQAEGYDLENPYNLEGNETIYDALMFLEEEVNEYLNKLIPSKGTYYMGYHEADGSYCLFYMETEREES
jgi:hypothetical protein